MLDSLFHGCVHHPMPKIKTRSYEKRYATYLCLLPIHSKVELILVLLFSFLLQPLNPILFLVVVSRS